MRKIFLVKKNNWALLFAEETQRIKEKLPDLIFELHHIGSTAIPGIAAKPVIDMLLEIENVESLDDKNNEFESLGYEVMGEYGIEGRRFFMKGGDQRSHHIHAFRKGSLGIKRHVAFRDYLIAHPKKAKEYEQLKIGLAEKFKESNTDYSEGKHQMIQSLEQSALKFFKLGVY